MIAATWASRWLLVPVVAAVLLIMAGVMLIRLPAEAVVGLPQWCLISRAPEWWSYMPRTLPMGAVLVAAGALLLTVCVGPAAPRASSFLYSNARGAPWKSGAALLVAGLVVQGFFFWAESIKKNSFLVPWISGPWLVALVVGVVLAWHIDARRHIPLKISLSGTEWRWMSVAVAALLAVHISLLPSWKFSYTGDEYAFYDMARGLAQEGLHRVNWFEASGVYGYHPVALSGWQALWMLLFGPYNFAWRLSSALVVLACVPPLYLFLRHVLARHGPAFRALAAAGCALFFLNEQLLVWAILPMQCNGVFPSLLYGLCLYAAARARGSCLLYLLAGMACGAGLYLYVLGTVLAVLLIGAWWMFDLLATVKIRRAAGSHLGSALWLAAGALLVSAPIAVQTDNFALLREHGTGFDLSWAWLLDALQRTLFALAMFLVYYGDDRFLAGNLIDPLFATLVGCGLGMGRWIGWRDWGAAVFLLVAVAFATGGLCQYNHLPVSRAPANVFPLAVLATFGLARLLAGRPSAAAVFAVVLSVGLCSFSVGKLLWFNPYQNQMPAELHWMQRIQESPPETRHVLVTSFERGGFYGEALMRCYRLQDRVISVTDDAVGLARLEDFLARHPGKCWISASEKVGDKTRLHALAETHRALLLPPLPDWSVVKRDWQNAAPAAGP